MKVRDLVDELKKCPQTAEVFIGIDEISDRCDIKQIVTISVNGKTWVSIFETKVVD